MVLFLIIKWCVGSFHCIRSFQKIIQSDSYLCWFLSNLHHTEKVESASKESK